MPSGYHFGITAASAETADSFEVNKFVVSTAQGVAREEPGRVQSPTREQQYNNFAPPGGAAAPVPIDHTPQFQDVNSRLESMARQFDSLLQEFRSLGDRSEARHQELSRNAMSADKLNAMDRRLEGIENTVKDYQRQFSSLQNIMRDSHSSITENLPKHMTDSAVTLFPERNLMLTFGASHHHKSPAYGASPLRIRRHATVARWFLCSIQATEGKWPKEISVN